MPAMNYVVLARKYRPRTFAQMVGQQHVVRALTNALQQRRLHHAYLFTGTRGIGKTTVSRILAKSLNCIGPDGQGGITAEPCGVCSVCTEIDADRFIDYTEMDAASNRGIDEARDLIERAAYKPSVGRFKVFMIDEAHQLTKDAFNALLKTLEEPPDYLKFVLATTDPEKMLPTVLSRCLQFNLRPMAPQTVREHLATVLAAEGIATDEGALRLLSHAAHGSMRDALSLTDQAISYGGGALDEALVRGMLGAVDGAMAVTIARALAQRDAAGVLAAVDQLREAGLSCDSTLEQMAVLLQQVAVEQAVPGALPDDGVETASARDLAPLLASDETQLMYTIVLQGRAELSLMTDEYAACTMVLLRFLAFPSATAASASVAAPRAAPLRAPSPPALKVAAPAPAPCSAVPAARMPAVEHVGNPDSAPPDSPDPVLGERWNSVVRRLIEMAEVSGLVRELAWQSELVSVESGSPVVWHLRAEHESLRTPALCEALSVAVSQSVGAPLRIELDAGVPRDSPARREAEQRARRQAQAEASIHDDPVVRELLSQFKTARIVPGSIKPV
jgi:DNA polymerase-3 subunit gamma/tau